VHREFYVAQRFSARSGRARVRFAPELAEGFGVFALVLVGCGAIIVDASTGALGHVGVSLAFGLVVGAMVYATGHVSGAHLNPAVTLAFAVTGHFPARRVPAYVAAQTAGALLAALVLRFVVPDAGTLGETRPAGIDWARTLVIEVLLTAILMFVVAAVATDGRAVGAMAGNAIGGAVALGSLWAGPLTGASMNPARSLGPALVGDGLGVVWLYVVGPAVGALLGAQMYEWIRRGDRPRGRVEVPVSP
jgi:MIP family channel proteins